MRPQPPSAGLSRAAFGKARLFFGSLDDPALADWTSLAPLPRDLDERPRSAAPARFLERRAVARHLVAEALGVAAEAVAIGHDARGAPVVLHPGAASLHISLSARAGAFAIALSPDPLGIDIESAAFDPRDIPWNVLHKEEQAMLHRLPAASLAQAFLRLWTAKEAVLKLLGAGLLHPPEQICITPERNGTFAIDSPGIDFAGARGAGGSAGIAGRPFVWSAVSLAQRSRRSAEDVA